MLFSMNWDFKSKSVVFVCGFQIPTLFNSPDTCLSRYQFIIHLCNCVDGVICFLCTGLLYIPWTLRVPSVNSSSRRYSLSSLIVKLAIVFRIFSMHCGISRILKRRGVCCPPLRMTWITAFHSVWFSDAQTLRSKSIKSSKSLKFGF